jgi:hypothetical protein
MKSEAEASLCLEELPNKEFSALIALPPCAFAIERNRAVKFEAIFVFVQKIHFCSREKWVQIWS